jgi:peptidoglycan/LPS O-acetylase OafA/YrhL
VRQLPYSGQFEVLIHHNVNAGWIGVDLFFILSGFLITGILLDSKDRANYFRVFYIRRALRILPLYVTYVTVVVCGLRALGLTSEAESAAISRTQWWYWTHTVNLLVARWGWNLVSWHSGHLWSLSVEEQFYLLWPAIVMMLRRRSLISVATALVVVVWCLRLALAPLGVPWTAVYVLLPTRMDSLAVGALLAAVARDPVAWGRIQGMLTRLAIGSAAVLIGIFIHNHLIRSAMLTQIAGYPALAVLGGTAVASAVSNRAGSIYARLLGTPALRFFGQYSYGLYVWHPLVIHWVQQHLSSMLRLDASSHLMGYLLFTICALTGSVALALLSWHLIEAPFLALKRFAPYAHA